MKFSLVIAVFACTFCLAVSDKVKFKDCGSTAGKIVSVDINPCPKMPCEFKRGTKVGASITFQSSEASTAVKSVVHGILGGIPVPFPLPDSNACNTMSPKCPLATGSQYVYTNQLEVLQSYPSLAVLVKWELIDPNSKDLVCFEIPVRIV
ncbi:hypothetical protein BOX15_Mlig024849g1 [Macrostomum lignano]|uniref:MD-2-related lipid-recognition domain-containing protein n=1 Tax=Macrostomum lignano TaxID=282301 RepID=A0A267GI73_9PLAT|nr:hypothetical protein BOX15_Mlig024849g1 [Macrostomum lignano]